MRMAFVVNIACTILSLFIGFSAVGLIHPETPISGPETPFRSEWQLGEPSTFENLTVFPVISDGTADSGELITLDEGLRSGTVTITEIGPNGRPRTIRQGQQRDNAEVNTLLVTNRSGKPLVLIAGEVLIGGKQDRIVGEDAIISSSNQPKPIKVFCVEHGRWSTGAFGRSQSNTNREEVVGVATAAEAFGLSAKTMAPPKIREKAQASKDQSAVWSEVDKTRKENRVESATGRLGSVYEAKEVKATLDQYEKSLSNISMKPGTVGAVIAVGGRVISADVFANNHLFRAYWPKLLRSYALGRYR